MFGLPRMFGLCLLGRHRPDPRPVCNAGRWFTRCRRCRRDLLLTEKGRWIVPRGYRIVWRPASSGPPRGIAPAPAERPGLRRKVRARGRVAYATDFMDDESRPFEWESRVDVDIP